MDILQVKNAVRHRYIPKDTNSSSGAAIVSATATTVSSYLKHGQTGGETGVTSAEVRTLSEDEKIGEGAGDNESICVWVESVEESMLREMFTLVVDMPVYPHKVLFEEKAYTVVTPHVPFTDPSSYLRVCGVPQSLTANSMGSSVGDLIEFNLVSMSSKEFSGSLFAIITDWEIGQDNPAEDQIRRLSKDSLRGSADPTQLKPNLQEKQKLDLIVQSPTSGRSAVLAMY